jgi:hypothetical protein
MSELPTDKIIKIKNSPAITVAPSKGVAMPSGAPGAMRSLHPTASSIRAEALPPPPTKSRRIGKLAAVCCLVLAAAVVVGVRFHPWRSPQSKAQRYVSGTARPRLTSSGKPEHWPTGAAIPAVLDPSLETMSPGTNEAIVEAFATWQAANLGTPSISLSIDNTRGVVAEDGINRIVYGPITIAGFEDAVAVTVSYADDDGVIIEADMIINDGYSFTVLPTSAADEAASTCGGRYDVQDVITHEAGHFLGLGEDMSDTQATMYIVSDPCQTHKRVLTADDLGAMKSLYAGVEPSAAGTGGCQGNATR